MRPDRTRSDLARAQGLGSAKSGVAHWWIQRVTAVALIPLTLWFATKLVTLAGADHEAFVEWLRSPLPAILMILLLIALFHHLTLGLQVIIEDYVHSARMKWIAVSAVQLGCTALAVGGVVSVVRIAVGG